MSKHANIAAQFFPREMRIDLYLLFGFHEARDFNEGDEGVYKVVSMLPNDPEGKHIRVYGIDGRELFALDAENVKGAKINEALVADFDIGPDVARQLALRVLQNSVALALAMNGAPAEIVNAALSNQGGVLVNEERPEQVH